jgi:putative ABC transport system ATP-binding protein
MSELIVTRGLTKIYNPQASNPVHALQDVDLTIDAGEFTAVAGPSGSGKTTLLNLISGLDRPTSGEVNVAGLAITGMSRSELAEFRLHNVGFVFQAYNLIPVLSARENAEFTLLLKGLPRQERDRLVREELADLGIGPDLQDRRPSELSGGQQQRVAVARALVGRPRLILADEPTANLDSTAGGRLLDKMKEMNQKTGITFLFSSHDPMVMERSSRLITLRDGRITGDEVRR